MLVESQDAFEKVLRLHWTVYRGPDMAKVVFVQANPGNAHFVKPFLKDIEKKTLDEKKKQEARRRSSEEGIVPFSVSRHRPASGRPASGRSFSLFLLFLRKPSLSSAELKVR